MLLALEIGNSHVSVGGFDGDELKFVAPIATDDRLTGPQIAVTLASLFTLYGAEARQFQHAVVGSVVSERTRKPASPCMVVVWTVAVASPADSRASRICSMEMLPV